MCSKTFDCVLLGKQCITNVWGLALGYDLKGSLQKIKIYNPGSVSTAYDEIVSGPDAWGGMNVDNDLSGGVIFATIARTTTER
jgi:hypothetical protein